MLIAFCIGTLIGLIGGAAAICLLAMWIDAGRATVQDDWETWTIDRR